MDFPCQLIKSFENFQFPIKFKKKIVWYFRDLHEAFFTIFTKNCSKFLQKIFGKCTASFCWLLFEINIKKIFRSGGRLFKIWKSSKKKKIQRQIARNFHKKSIRIWTRFFKTTMENYSKFPRWILRISTKIFRNFYVIKKKTKITLNCSFGRNSCAKENSIPKIVFIQSDIRPNCLFGRKSTLS